MNTKFTKGPWVCVCPEERHVYDGSELTDYTIYSKKTRGEMNDMGIGSHYRQDLGYIDNVEIAHAYWGDMLDDEAKANAHLIAVAPELYEELLDRYESEKCGCNHPACKSCKRDQETLVVLKKARGES